MSSYPEGAGKIVKAIWELRRVLNPDPKTEALLAMGFLLGTKDEASYEAGGRTITIDRIKDGDTVIYTLSIEEKGIITSPFVVVYDGPIYLIDKYTRGSWEKDLSNWFTRQRTQKLLTAGTPDAAGVP
jgi:hypothetical protein